MNDVTFIPNCVTIKTVSIHNFVLLTSYLEFMSIYPDKHNVIVLKNILRISGVILSTILINACEKESSLSDISKTDANVFALQVQDIDGNTYKSVKIGDQVWMSENLETTKYNDGEPISLVSDGLVWETLATPAYCIYDSKSINTTVKYGALYNWYTVNTGKLCPKKWHVPSDSEWKLMEINILMDRYEAERIGWRGTNQGDALKANIGWHSPDDGTNKTGFSALPGGYINNSGELVFVEINGNWWSSTQYFEENAYYRRLYYNESKVGRFNTFKTAGFSVRCIKD